MFDPHDARITELNQQIDSIRQSMSPQLAWLGEKPKSNRRLHIFSGSFNPLSIAHIELVDTAKYRFERSETLLLLAVANVDKTVFGLSLAERLLILEHYVQQRSQDGWSLAICSHGRFIDKLQALKSSGLHYDDYVFIVGYDTLIRIFEPKYYKDFATEMDALFTQCRFIAATRETADLGVMREFLARPLVMPYAEKIELITLPQSYLEISSTDIRARLAQQLPIDTLVPSEVHSLVLKLAQA